MWSLKTIRYKKWVTINIIAITTTEMLNCLQTQNSPTSDKVDISNIQAVSIENKK